MSWGSRAAPWAATSVSACSHRPAPSRAATTGGTWRSSNGSCGSCVGATRSSRDDHAGRDPWHTRGRHRQDVTHAATRLRQQLLGELRRPGEAGQGRRTQGDGEVPGSSPSPNCTRTRACTWSPSTTPVTRGCGPSASPTSGAASSSPPTTAATSSCWSTSCRTTTPTPGRRSASTPSTPPPGPWRSATSSPSSS